MSNGLCPVFLFIDNGFIKQNVHTHIKKNPFTRPYKEEEEVLEDELLLLLLLLLE
jgi:hypothetical protein